VRNLRNGMDVCRKSLSLPEGACESRLPGLLVLTVLTASQCSASFPSQARLIGIASKTCNFAADQVNPRKDK